MLSNLTGIQFLTGFVEISIGGASDSVAIKHRVGDDQCWAAPGLRAREARAGSAGPVGRNSAHGE
jgi:hypothetical protein